MERRWKRRKKAENCLLVKVVRNKECDESWKRDSEITRNKKQKALRQHSKLGNGIKMLTNFCKNLVYFL